MHRMIVRHPPAAMKDYEVAVYVLPTARARGADTIILDRPGRRPEFSVAHLERLQQAGQVPAIRFLQVPESYHHQYGGWIEQRLPTWPGFTAGAGPGH
jgi:hypothetical protein